MKIIRLFVVVGLTYLFGADYASTLIAAPPDLSANMACHWQMDEVSGNAISSLDTTNCDLTDTGTVGAGTIDGTAARDFEIDVPTYFTRSGSVATAVGSNDAPFSVCTRVKGETWPNVGSLASIANVYFEWRMNWAPGVGFQFAVIDEGFGTGTATASSYSGDPGATVYNICGGHDAAGDVAWIRVNSDSRITAGVYVQGTRSSTGDPMNVGLSYSSDNPFDGLIGPITYWKRSISDGDMDDWVTAKGDYDTITGGGGGGPVVPCLSLLLGVGKCNDLFSLRY